VREDFANYLGEAMVFDAGLGILLQMLEERSEFGNTLIVISDDHGISGFSNGKCNLYNFRANVALATRFPSLIKKKVGS
jgi:arylsulfatase A-like enzyme